jgi:hypothetical protein
VLKGIELLSNGFRVLERSALMGRPTFPFIDQGRGRGYTGDRERKKEKKKEKRQRRREPWSYVALLL